MKEKIYLRIVLLSVILALLIVLPNKSSGELDEEDTKGLVTYIDGRVKKKVSAQKDWVNAATNTPVNSGDLVRTYIKSRAELELLKLDVIRMAPETTIDIVKLYEETKGKIKETKITLQQGDIWAKLSEKSETMKFDISSPVAAAAITGTVLRMAVKSDSTTQVKVYQGEVRVSNIPETQSLAPSKSFAPFEIPGPHEIQGPREISMEEWVYVVKSMQSIVIGNDGTVKQYGDFSLEDPDEQSDWINWNLQLDNLKK
ncbi:FecR domain-containing protein [candidate division KSB1 bacterium]|nr:FecR domain-containing protein [candidate division KSB1 bacterium]